jgi:hypothetical protein
VHVPTVRAIALDKRVEVVDLSDVHEPLEAVAIHVLTNFVEVFEAEDVFFAVALRLLAVYEQRQQRERRVHIAVGVANLHEG